MAYLLALLSIAALSQTPRWLRRWAVARPIPGAAAPYALRPAFVLGPPVDADQVEIAAHDLRVYHAQIAAFLAACASQR